MRDNSRIQPQPPGTTQFEYPDNHGGWEIQVEEADDQGSISALAYGDETWGQSAPRFVAEDIGLYDEMAIQTEERADAGVGEEPDPPAPDPPPEVVADIAAQVGRIRALRQKSVVWRIDVFFCGPHTRRVSAPPWSLRTHTIEPNVWPGIGKPAQKKYREAGRRQTRQALQNRRPFVPPERRPGRLIVSPSVVADSRPSGLTTRRNSNGESGAHAGANVDYSTSTAVQERNQARWLSLAA